MFNNFPKDGSERTKLYYELRVKEFSKCLHFDEGEDKNDPRLRGQYFSITADKKDFEKELTEREYWEVKMDIYDLCSSNSTEDKEKILKYFKVNIKEFLKLLNFSIHKKDNSQYRDELRDLSKTRPIKTILNALSKESLFLTQENISENIYGYINGKNNYFVVLNKNILNMLFRYIELQFNTLINQMIIVDSLIETNELLTIIKDKNKSFHKILIKGIRNRTFTFIGEKLNFPYSQTTVCTFFRVNNYTEWVIIKKHILTEKNVPSSSFGNTEINTETSPYKELLSKIHSK